jgi:hypothetical protein
MTLRSAGAWIGEDTAPLSDIRFEPVRLTPKSAAALHLSNVEMLLRQDFAAVLGQSLDRAALGEPAPHVKATP